MKKSKLAKGFTLVELLVVMALIAVLAVLILGAIQLARNTATETVHRSNAKVIQATLEANFAKFKRYCGAGEGEIDCPAATNNGTTGTASAYSFTEVAAAISPNVNLSTGASEATSATPPLAKCGSGGADAGGGRITNLTTTGYAIAPVTYNCQGFTAVSDVIQTGLTTQIDKIGDVAADDTIVF